MEELELEALEYENSFVGGANGTEATDFIAGATSKWVEKQKLEFAIEQLKSVNYKPDSKFFWLTDIGKKIKKLEQKLSEL